MTLRIPSGPLLSRLRPFMVTPLAGLVASCAALGSVMSPYSEKFSCKNSDHGQCIHPEDAYRDAVAGRQSRSDPKVTADRTLLRDQRTKAPMPGVTAVHSGERVQRAARGIRGAGPVGAYASYRDGVYRELRDLIDAPVTPMLKSPRTVRTLILPYADRTRPDRLYMPRFVYSILEAPDWVVGGYLALPPQVAGQLRVLDQGRDPPPGGASETARELQP